MIGSSLEAKILLYVPEQQLREQRLPTPRFQDLTNNKNGVDELRYLFITSQVELLDSPEALEGLKYSFQSDPLGIGVVKADGEKCDRCWNYSIHVGELVEHPLLCERCIPALAGQF